MAAFVLLAAPFGVGPVRGEPLPSLQRAAAKLQAATVTIRIAPIPAPAGRAAADDEPAQDGDPAGRAAVTVCSGVSLGQGLIVTSAAAGADVRIRITIPGGDQAEARPRVVDHYSGLMLLETDGRLPAALAIGPKTLPVGAWIVGAAAWGIEMPVVSHGILAGTGRSIRGAVFPPLLQCDLRTTQTSAGSPVVDLDGRLIGVIVAVDDPGQGRGWTYAVPASHVTRLLRARAPGELVILRRRRPVVGMVLGSSNGQVLVQRVTEDGPADRAGIAVGDRVLAADGKTIRSVYQAVLPVMQKQPGDAITFQIAGKSGPRRVEVTLGGSGELPPSSATTATPPLLDPRVEVNQIGPDRFDVKDAQSGTRNLQIRIESAGTPLSEAARDRLLQQTVVRYAQLVARLQADLARRERDKAATQEQIQTLQEQIETLRQQLAENARR